MLLVRYLLHFKTDRDIIINKIQRKTSGLGKGDGTMLKDVAENILDTLFWIYLLWCLVVKGFTYCLIRLIIIAPVVYVATPFVVMWLGYSDEKKHPEKYKNRRKDNFCYWVDTDDNG